MNKIDRLYKVFDYIIPAYLVVTLVEYILNYWALEFPVKLFAIGFTLLFLIQNKVHSSATIKTLLTIFILYNLLSFVKYFVNGREIECYMSDLYNYIAAMLFFYVGFYDTRRENFFYNKFLVFCFAAMIIGLLFYVFMPSFHLVRHNTVMSAQWFSTNSLYSDDEIMSMMRFSGIIGSDYGVGIFCMCGLSIAFFYYSKGVKVKYVPAILSILVFIIGAFMTQLRIVIVCASATTVYYLFFGNKGSTQRTLKLIFVSFFIGAIALFVVSKYFGDRASVFMDIMDSMSERMDFKSAYSERSGQVETTFAAWDSYILGQGMGSANAIARKNGHPGITDQCYAKMLVELGFVGVTIFAIIMLATLYKGVLHLKKNLIEMVIIVYVLCSMIGANTLYFHYFQILPFWYAVGRLWNPFIKGVNVTNKIIHVA